MADSHKHQPDEINPEVGFETTDANVKHIVVAGLGLTVATILACFAMYLVFAALKHEASESGRQPINPMAGPRAFPPMPRIEERPWEEMQVLNARDAQILGTYGKGSNGTIRIPIEKAMDIVVQKGLPTRAPGAQPATAPFDTATAAGANPQAVPRMSATPSEPVPQKENTGAAKK